MDHVVTIGMIVDTVLVIFGAVVALGILLWILSVIASGFNH